MARFNTNAIIGGPISKDIIPKLRNLPSQMQPWIFVTSVHGMGTIKLLHKIVHDVVSILVSQNQNQGIGSYIQSAALVR